MKHFQTSKERIGEYIWFSQLHFFTGVEIVHHFWDSVAYYG